jgi:hypothetical protein
MSRARMAAALLMTLALAAGCENSGSGANGPASTPTPSTSPSPFPGMSAEEIWRQSMDALDHAEAVHLIANIPDGEDRKDTAKIDLRMTTAPKAIGTLTRGGHEVSIRRIGNVLYLNGDAGFWQDISNPQLAIMLASRWTKTTKGPEAMEMLFELTEVHNFAHKVLDRSPAQQAKLLIVPGIEVDGKPTVGLSNTPAGKEAEGSGILYVASNGPALPMQLKLGIDGVHYLKFTDWNKAVTVTAPAGAFNLDPFLKKKG